MKIIAHRGFSFSAPENTLSAVRQALASGTDYIEVDVRISKDHVPVIFHDADIFRTTTTKHAQFIHNLTLTEVKALDAGGWFHRDFELERIPTLSELLKLDWRDSGLMLEIKGSWHPEELLVTTIFEVLKNAKKPLPKILIGSFSFNIIEKVRELLPQLDSAIGLIGICERLQSIETFVKGGIGHLAIWHEILSPELLNLLNSHNIKVWTFTVDELDRANDLVSLGIQGIITNNPQLQKEFQYEVEAIKRKK